MKTTNWIMAALMASAILIAVPGMMGCKKSESAPAPNATAPSTNQVTVQYTCSMHPEVVQDKPGTCPKCGMALVVKK